MKFGLVSLTRATVLSLGVAVLVPTLAAAQTASDPPAFNVPSFAKAIQGQNVWITADGARRRGRVTSLSPTGLVLVGDGKPTTIAYGEIVRVEKSTHRLRNSTLIGLAVGAGLGLAVVSRMEGYEAEGLATYFPICAGIGAAAGLGIGAINNAVNKDTDVLYDARRRTTTMALAPILSPTRKGVAFSMTWR